MDYQVQKEARVWSRVMGGGESGCTCTGGLSPDTLAALMEKEQEASCLFSALTKRVCRREQGRLTRLWEESRCRMQRLGAVYFVLTGQKFCPATAPAPCITCTAEHLRLAYKETLARTEQYCALAKQGEFAHVFDCLACSAGETAKALLCVIAATV